MASNVQAGTRGLSAGDWIRLKRLQAPRGLIYYKSGPNSPPPLEYNKDITNSVLRLEPESGRRVYTEFGTSKVRRPASSWTDYIASQTADYVLERQNSETKSRSLDIHKDCTCNETSITLQTVDMDTDVIYVYGNLLDIVNGQVTFNGLTTEGTIIKNGVVFYVVYAAPWAPGLLVISISQTLDGPIIDPVTDGVQGLDGAATITVYTSHPPPSAIKHNGLCVKCIHS